MPDAKDSAIQEALLDAYLDDLKDNKSKQERVLAVAQTDEGEFTSFVDEKDAEKVSVYNQYDGVESRILVSMLSKQLRKRFPRSVEIPEHLWGKRAFAVSPPSNMPTRQALLCWFHPKSDRREMLNELGLGGRVCRKSNIPTEIDIELHMQRKHTADYNTVKEAVRRRDEAEDRAMRRQEIEALRAMAAATVREPEAPAAPVTKKVAKEE